MDADCWYYKKSVMKILSKNLMNLDESRFASKVSMWCIQLKKNVRLPHSGSGHQSGARGKSQPFHSLLWTDMDESANYNTESSSEYFILNPQNKQK